MPLALAAELVEEELEELELLDEDEDELTLVSSPLLVVADGAAGAGAAGAGAS